VYSIRRFIYAFLDLVTTTFSNWLFMITQRGASRRKWLLTILGAFLWAFLGWKKHPLVLGMEPLRNFIEYPFISLFAADVFRHVLIAGLVFWFAYRVAAIYLDDIFELNNVNIAERFIRQAAFASQYNVIEIRDGEVAQKDKLSPIFLIGGPGMVRVHMENAALFEKIDGEAHVISPTVRIMSAKSRNDKQSATTNTDKGNNAKPSRDGVEILEGFERLRSVIDLRDQFEDLTVRARTRDGIIVEVSDVRYVFSVYRDHQQPTLSRPYPFQKEAIENLVFEQSKQHWSNTMKGLIKRKLSEFISERTLSEFLAAINIPELEQQIEEEARLRQSADDLAGVVSSGQQSEYETPAFTPRSELTDIFYDFTSNFTKIAEKIGVEMRWIGVGTWVTPDEIIPEQHVKAWRITRDNIAREGKQALEGLENQSRNGALVGLIQETITTSNQQIDSMEGDEAKAIKQIVEAYRTRLRIALDIYEQSDRLRSPEARRLRQVLEHLARVTYRWLGDANG
jgi:hypothetical protein